MKTFLKGGAVLAAALFVATSAAAHVGLAVTGASAPGTTNLFGFGPGHGCDGADTNAILIQIPEGISSVKPVAKPGWEIEIVADEAGAVTEIHFTGGSLPDAWYDQFWIRARIDETVAAGTGIYFPVVQQCGEAEILWLALPGPDGAEPEGEPAPGFTVHEAVEGAGGH